MSPIAGSAWPAADYSFHPFRVETTEIAFCYSRKAAGGSGPGSSGCKGSNVSAAWTPRHQETLINGVLQGRKQTDRMGASALSRLRIWDLVLTTVGLVNVSMAKDIHKMSYLDMKRGNFLEHRRRVKDDVKSEALKGWNN